jgi:hypothetical protein
VCNSESAKITGYLINGSLIPSSAKSSVRRPLNSKVISLGGEVIAKNLNAMGGLPVKARKPQ